MSLARGRVGDVVPSGATDEQLLELYGPKDGQVVVDFRRFLRGEAVCRVCGCTDERACEGGCRWVDIDLCSRCV